MSVIGPVQSRFDKIPACGRQMDGQTHVFIIVIVFYTHV